MSVDDIVPDRIKGTGFFTPMDIPPPSRTSLNDEELRSRLNSIVVDVAFGAIEREDLESYVLELERIVKEQNIKHADMVIGEDEAPKPKPRSKDISERVGTCWACYEEDYCTHKIRDNLREEQRERNQI